MATEKSVPPAFRLLARERRVDEFLKIDQFEFKYRKWSGEESRTLKRFNVHRGDAVAGLLHWRIEGQPSRLILVKQFRFSTILSPDDGAPNPDAAAIQPIDRVTLEAGSEGWRQRRPGWEIELMAGMRDADEPWAATLVRETEEETRLKLDVAEGSLQYIGSFYPSMGACSERIHLYYAEVTPGPEGLPDLAGEGDEEIVVVTMTPAEFLKAIENNEIVDAKAIAAAEWMRRKDKRKLFEPEIE